MVGTGPVRVGVDHTGRRQPPLLAGEVAGRRPSGRRRRAPGRRAPGRDDVTLVQARRPGRCARRWWAEPRDEVGADGAAGQRSHGDVPPGFLAAPRRGGLVSVAVMVRHSIGDESHTAVCNRPAATTDVVGREWDAIPTILDAMTPAGLSVRLYTALVRVLPGVVAGGVLCAARWACASAAAADTTGTSRSRSDPPSVHRPATGGARGASGASAVGERASDRAPARERPHPACVAGERNDSQPDPLRRSRSSRRRWTPAGNVAPTSWAIWSASLSRATAAARRPCIECSSARRT